MQEIRAITLTLILTGFIFPGFIELTTNEPFVIGNEVFKIPTPIAVWSGIIGLAIIGIGVLFLIAYAIRVINIESLSRC